MENVSLWMGTTPSGGFPALTDNVSCDVAVIGGGIAGLMCALALAEEGKRVVVLEKDLLAQQASGRAMAKVTADHCFAFSPIIKRYGASAARLHARFNIEGFDRIAEVISRYGIECGFEHDTNYTVASIPAQERVIDDEFHAVQIVGFSDARLVRDADISFEVIAAIEVAGQARFNPRAFVLGVAHAVESLGGSVYEHSEATSLAAGDRCVVGIEEGASVDAAQVVVATGVPVLLPGEFLESLDPWRGYVCAFETTSNDEQGMSYRRSGDVVSFRRHRQNETRYVLLSGGVDEAASETSPEDHFRAIEDWGSEHLDLGDPSYRWWCQDVYTPDRLPAVGFTDPESKRVIVVTGFCAWGMTKSAACASLVADLVSGRSTPYAALYRPQRPALVVSESGDHGISRGSGAIVDRGGEKYAVYVAEDGAVHAMSARCPHRGCIVGWNATELVWDCPCHGSRYSAVGDLVNGPATRGLTKVDPSVLLD